jgi:hypothetical protein
MNYENTIIMLRLDCELPYIHIIYRLDYELQISAGYIENYEHVQVIL